MSLRKGHHEGLISLETYTRIQERIKEGARVAARPDLNADFPLRGFVLCGSCERPLTACWSKSKTGKRHPYYYCFNRACEHHGKSIRRESIERAFSALIREVTPPAPRLKVAGRMFADLWNTRLARRREQAALHHAKRAELDKQIEGFLDRLVAAENPSVIAAYEKRIAQLEQEKLIVAERAASVQVPPLPFDKMFELAMRFLAKPCKLWESGRIDLQRLVLRLTFTDPIPYCRDSGFRTPELSIPFKTLGGIFAAQCGMVSPARFELTAPGLGIPCSILLSYGDTQAT